MSDVSKSIFGGTSSGTPVETQGLARQMAGLYGGAAQGVSNPFGRFTQGAMQNILGQSFSPEMLGSSFAQAMSYDPAQQIAAVQASLNPLEQQASDMAGNAVRSSMGTLGGRFSRNAMDAEGRARGQVAQQYGNIRANTALSGTLAANQNQNSLLQGLGQLLLGAGQLGTQQLGQIGSFAQPGAPVMQQGILPGLAGQGGQLGLLKLLAPALLA